MNRCDWCGDVDDIAKTDPGVGCETFVRQLCANCALDLEHALIANRSMIMAIDMITARTWINSRVRAEARLLAKQVDVRPIDWDVRAVVSDELDSE